MLDLRRLAWGTVGVWEGARGKCGVYFAAARGSRSGSRKPLCRQKAATCRPGWLAYRARTVSTAASGPHPKNGLPPFFPPFPKPPREPLQMMRSDGGERRLEGMGRHKNTHTHTHARTHTLPSPEKPSSVPDLGACLPCVSSEGTCAFARAGLLACTKHGASSTTVHKKGWREGEREIPRLGSCPRPACVWRGMRSRSAAIHARRP